MKILNLKQQEKSEKVTKKKDNKLSAKWKGYDNLFNSWIDEKINYMIKSYYIIIL